MSENVHRRFIKVTEKTKIRDLNNKIPSLTQESDKNAWKHHTQESQEVSPFPGGDYKAARNRHDSVTLNTNNKKDPHKKHRLGTVSEKIAGGLNHVWRYQPLPHIWCRSSQKHIWFVWKIPNFSMYHLIKYQITLYVSYRKARNSYESVFKSFAMIQ